MAARRGRVVLAGLKGRRPTHDLFAHDVIYKELTVARSTSPSSRGRPG